MSVVLYMDVHIQQDAAIGDCVTDLAILAQVYDPPDMENRVVYLPL